MNTWNMFVALVCLWWLTFFVLLPVQVRKKEGVIGVSKILVISLVAILMTLGLKLLFESGSLSWVLEEEEISPPPEGSS